MASPEGTNTLKRTGKLQSSSDFTGPRRRCDSPAHDHGKTPVAGRLHPINNVKQRINQHEADRPNSLSLIPKELGGADRDRTDDLKLAKLALSQLSYGPDHSENRDQVIRISAYQLTAGL